MSDSSRKRSRKSKLVPRECIEIEDDSLQSLQTKEWKVPIKILPKPITHSSTTAQNTPSSSIVGSQGCDDFEALIDNVNKPPEREFKITVAIEKFDEDSSDLVIDEQPSQEDTDDEKTEVINDALKPTGVPQTEIRVFAYNSKAQVEHTVNIGVEDSSKMHILKRNKILDITNDIINESDNPADKLLGIEVKNCMGHFPVVTRDIFQEKIQRVLDQWQDWQKVLLQKYRSPPLFYKCYICKLSWWHLYNFRKHLKKHEDFKLNLEESSLYEANVIAYQSVQDTINIQEFETEGNCPRCEKDFSAHKIANRLKDCNYKCGVPHCIKSFQTCSLLKQHETTCHTFSELNGTTVLAIQWKKTCEVCGIVCHTQIGYRSHMILLHSVRSDVVVEAIIKRCQLCHSKYAYSTAHLCPNRGVSMQCQSCFRLFPQGILYNAHKSKKGHVRCNICNVRLPLKCMEAEHLMRHTDKFQIVHKCIPCDKFTIFLDEQAATHHEFTKHFRSRNYEPVFGINLKFIDKIIIPKACLQYSRAVVEGVPQIAIKEEPKISTDPPAPEFEIKQEIIDDFECNADNDHTDSAGVVESAVKQEENIDNDENSLIIEENSILDEGLVMEEDTPMTIKEEITYEDNFDVEKIQERYSIKIEPPDSHSRIFGIKVEPELVKQEVEEEYEDDIIKLDFSEETSQEAIEVDPEEVMKNDNFETMQESIEIDPEEVMNESTENDDLDSEDTNENDKQNGKSRKLYRCNKCGIEAVHKTYKKHIETECERNYGHKGVYACSKCNKIFMTFRKFIEHFTQHGLPHRSCPVCFRSYEAYNALLAHVSMHIRTKYMSVRMITLEGQSAGFNFQCRVCKEYVNKPDFFQHWEKHLTIVDRGDKNVQVVSEEISDGMKNEKRKSAKPINDFVVQKLLELLQSFEHMEKLRPGCIICHKYFTRRNDFKRHLIEHLLCNAYANMPKYNCLRCQICPKGFKKAEVYKKHMRDHGSLPVYKCEICDRTFSDSSNFTKHKKIHNINAFTCDICGKKFQAKHSIIKHMAIHETQKPLTCVPCNKVFYLQSALRKHNRTQHDKSTPKFGCAICSARFETLRSKWDHLWQVHKMRKYKADCLLCNKSYRRFLDLKHHLNKEHQPGLIKHTRVVKSQSSSKSAYELLRDTQIVGLRSAEETLVIYDDE